MYYVFVLCIMSMYIWWINKNEWNYERDAHIRIFGLLLQINDYGGERKEAKLFITTKNKMYSDFLYLKSKQHLVKVQIPRKPKIYVCNCICCQNLWISYIEMSLWFLNNWVINNLMAFFLNLRSIERSHHVSKDMKTRNRFCLNISLHYSFLYVLTL